MLISRDKATMIIDICAKIRDQLGISVGYIHPSVAFVSEHNEFIIREQDDEIQLIHVDDLILEQHGTAYQHYVKEEPENDDKVEEFLNKINQAVWDGKITFDPGVTKTIDGIEMSVTQRDFSHIDGMLYEVPMQGPYGHLFTYPAIRKLAVYDHRFKVAKKIIDEQWPEEAKYWIEIEETSLEDTQKIEIEEPPAKESHIRKILRKLLDWLSNN